ncbi:MAG: hypothetical protein ACLRXQ_05090 [Phascolarctobacterium faecium]
MGMVRTVNEDALLTTGPELFALADGMGGYAAGETASREALQVLQQEAENLRSLLAPSYAPPCVNSAAG